MTAESPQPGDALRQAREARGLSVQQAAEAMFLTTARVLALEAQQWEQLPAPVFVRGYIRTYARLLALDESALVQSYDRIAPARQNTRTSIEEPAWNNLGRRPARRTGPLSAIIVLLLGGLVAVLFWQLEPSLEDEADTAQQNRTLPAAPAHAEDPSPTQIGGDATVATEAVEDAEDAEETETESGRNGAEASPIPSESALQTSLPSVPNGLAAGPQLLERHVRITTNGQDELEFAFVENSWVEVRNTDAVLLYAAEGQQGERLRLLGQGPFQVVLGYGPGVVLRFNGEDVSLDQYTADNQVSSLALGG